jgi:colicin import membrane protein
MSAAMNTMPGMQVTRNTHGDRNKARALALTMHVAFFVLLIFGVSWQKKPETPIIADLWSHLPPMQQPKMDLPPPEPPPAPRPAPRVEPPPVPKAAPAPVVKPDIAIQKKEKEKKAAPKEPPKAEPKKDDKAEKARKEAEARKAAEREAHDKKILEIERAAEAKAAAEKAAAERARASEMQKYVGAIQSKVWARVALPPDLPGNAEAEVVVSLLPGGELLNATIRKTSGNAAYDAAILQAIRQAQPFSVPSGDDFHRYFRQFPMTFRPR